MATAAAIEAERSEPHEVEEEVGYVVEEEENEEEEEEDDDEEEDEEYDARGNEEGGGGDGDGVEERGGGDGGEQGEAGDRAVKISSPLTMDNIEGWLMTDTPVILNITPATETGRSGLAPIDQLSSVDDSTCSGYSMSSSSSSSSSSEDDAEPKKKKKIEE